MTWATPSAVELLILALAGYRLYRFAAIDEFPPMEKLRRWAIGDSRPADGEWNPDGPARPWSSWATDLFACPFCLGFWISLALVAAWWAWPVAALAFALPWAVAAVLALVTVHLDPS